MRIFSARKSLLVDAKQARMEAAKLAQTNEHRKALLRSRRMKRRLKRVMWAGVFVAIGAVLVHNPFAVTAQAAQTQTASSAVSVGQTDGEKTFGFLQKAMSSTKATPTGYAVHDWSVVNHQFMSESQVKSLGQQLQQEFGISNAKVNSRSEKEQSFWQVDGRWPNATNVRLVLTSLQGTGASPQNGDTAPETVLTITALGSASGMDGFAAQYDQIEHMVGSVQGTPQMSAYLTGDLGAEKTEAESQQIAKAGLAAVGAIGVESLKTQYETSLSGYAKGAPAYIYTSGRRMNVQVAVHDDTYHHRTDVLVGTPIITTTY